MEHIPLADSEAWYYNPEGGEDQTTPHQFYPNQPVSPEQLRELGIVVWKLDADSYPNDPLLEMIKRERGYNHWDVVTVAPGKIDEFEDKARHFFVEHLHACEEIRFVLDGTGYFDVRDRNDDWIRLKITRGDFIILPSGMYHRFTLDESLYIQALRLFIELPKWTDQTRPKDKVEANYTEIARSDGSEQLAARRSYVEKVAASSSSWVTAQ